MSEANDIQITAVDYARRQVTCTAETWAQHVIGHPEMIGQEEAVRSTIETPDAVFRSGSHPNTRELHFALGRHSVYHGVYTCVVVGYSNQRGDVITSYVCREMTGNIAEGGVLYVRPTR